MSGISVVVMAALALLAWQRRRLQVGEARLSSVRTSLVRASGAGEVPVYYAVAEAIAHGQESGAFDGCIWGRAEGAVCARPTEWIIEATGRLFTPTIAWIPACEAHAGDLGHWTSTALMWRGRYEPIRPDELARRTRYKHRLGGVTSLIVFPGVTESERLHATVASSQKVLSRPQPYVELPGHVGGRRYTRRVREATPLSADADAGRAAEVATSGAASLWGVADFVFKASLQVKGSGVREVGNTLLVLERIGVVVQVKRRVGRPTDPEHEGRWVQKAVAKAEKQAIGSIRTLKTESVPAVSARGDEVTFEPDERQWIGVIIVDHDQIPADLEPRIHSNSTVVLSRRDWEFLFARLKSTHAVVDYLLLILEGLGAGPLDTESARHLDLASPIPPGWSLPEKRVRYHTNGRTETTNAWSAFEDPGDIEALTFYRSILEDAAIHPSDWITRFTILNLLDSLPLPARVMLARKILNLIDQRSRSRARFLPPVALTRLRISPTYPQFAVVVSGRDGDNIDELSHLFAAYEHHKMSAVDGFTQPLTTIGLGIVAPSREHEGWQMSLGILNHLDPLESDAFEALRVAFGPDWDEPLELS